VTSCLWTGMSLTFFLQCTTRCAKKEMPDGNKSLTFGSFHNGERKGGMGGGGARRV
jgi:hypothetical protein